MSRLGSHRYSAAAPLSDPADTARAIRTLDEGEKPAERASIRLSDQIEQLDEIIPAKGDGTAFFEETSVTARHEGSDQRKASRD